jgi:mannose-6-phosphate isomerase-like protein (cupin superfamily)
MTENVWELFDIDQLRSEFAGRAIRYREFLRVPALHCGLYRLERGSRDMQTPHDEDEVYYVLEGKAKLKVGDELKEVSPGMLLYVRATETHSFFEIEEDMVLLVVFATGPLNR